MKYRKLLIIGAAAIFIACPAKQGEKREDKHARLKDTLIVQAETEPAHLVNMIQPDGMGHKITAHNVLESLLRLDPKSYEMEGELAESWTVSEDKRIYTFKLRKGVKWHDGRPFSARDVKFTLDRLLDNKVRAASARATLGPHIDHYQVNGPHEFIIVCKRASPFFEISISDLAILPEHVFGDADLNTHPALRHPVGTGPYRMVTWKSGQQITLQRFDGYWGKKPRIKRIIYRFVRSPEIALKLARKGELDFIPRLRAAQWAGEVQRDRVIQQRFTVIKSTAPGTSYILLNHKRPLFRDVKVRRALNMLLDRQTIAAKIYHGLAQSIGALYWIKDPNYNHAIKPATYNPARARALLAEAGYQDRDQDGVLERSGRPLRFTFLQVASSKSTGLWLTIYQQALRKAGVLMDISPIDWAAYVERLRRHDFDAGALVMVHPGPYSDLYLQFHSGQIADGQNYGAFSNPLADRLLEQIQREMDPRARRNLSLKVQRLLAREVAAIPLFAFDDPALVTKRARGVYTSALWYQIRDWWFE